MGKYSKLPVGEVLGGQKKHIQKISWKTTYPSENKRLKPPSHGGFAGSDESPLNKGGTFLGEAAVSFFSGEVGVSISQHFIFKNYTSIDPKLALVIRVSAP